MKNLPLIMLLFCLGCSSKPKAPAIQIALVDSGRSLKITGLSYSVIQDVNRDSSNNWENLLKVYKMPADTDMKDFQPLQPGQFLLKDSALVFSPDTPFIQKNLYFIRYYRYNETGDIWSFIKAERKAGKVNHIDLIFKP